MLAMLQIVIGIVFVMLLFSLLASTVMELLAGYLSLRGRQLVRAIQGMVGSDVTSNFLNHPFFQQLAAGSRERTRFAGKKRALPSYITGSTFSAILLDIMEIDNRDDLKARIESLPEGASKKLAEFLYKQTNGDVIEFKKKLEEWFGEVMDRASGSYKRNAQRWLVGIGLALAIIFNADVIHIYHNLSVNSSLRDMVADAATVFVNTQPAPTAPNLDNPNMAEARQKIGQLVNDNIGAIASPLGLGWDSVDWSEANGKWWLYKIVGWLTTALGVSLGATFWFEALKKLVSLRAAGPAPTATTTTVTQTSAAPVQTTVTSGGALTQPEPEGVFESVKRSGAAPPKKPSRSKSRK